MFFNSQNGNLMVPNYQFNNFDSFNETGFKSPIEYTEFGQHWPASVWLNTAGKMFIGAGHDIAEVNTDPDFSGPRFAVKASLEGGTVQAITGDASGNLFAVSSVSSRVYKITLSNDGQTSTFAPFAGNGVSTWPYIDGESEPLNVHINNPLGIAVISLGDVFFSSQQSFEDTQDGRIMHVNAVTGKLSSLVGGKMVMLWLFNGYFD